MRVLPTRKVLSQSGSIRITPSLISYDKYTIEHDALTYKGFAEGCLDGIKPSDEIKAYLGECSFKVFGVVAVDARYFAFLH